MIVIMIMIIIMMLVSACPPCPPFSSPAPPTTGAGHTHAKKIYFFQSSTTGCPCHQIFTFFTFWTCIFVIPASVSKFSTKSLLEEALVCGCGVDGILLKAVIGVFGAGTGTAGVAGILTSRELGTNRLIA